MKITEALEVVAKHRTDQIVVTAMSSVGIWSKLSDSPLDFAYIPSSMGQGSSLGLGLALALPDKAVIAINGDGCTLMNLGCLVTIASYPANLFLLVIDNGIYEVTGGQKTVGSGRVDYAGIARSAGIPRVYGFDEITGWKREAEEVLTGTGPVFVQLKVEARHGQKTPKAPYPMKEQIRRLRQSLGMTPP